MAQSEVLARLAVDLQMNSASFEKGVKRASKQADEMGDRMEKMGRRVGLAIKGVYAAGAAFAAGQFVGAVKDMVVSSLDYASSLGEVAQQLGVTTDALQEYRYAATQVGIEQDDMDKGLQKLSVQLGKWSIDVDSAQKALGKYGLSASEIVKVTQMTAQQAIPRLADAYGKLKSDTEKAAFAAEIFGAKLGPKMQTLLAEGAKGIDTLTQRAHELGVVLSRDEIQKADETADKISELQTVLKMRIASAVVQNAEAIGKLADKLIELATAAVQAVREYVAFNDYMGQVARADIFLNNRTFKHPEAREMARQQARQIISKRTGVTATQSGSYLGGLITTQRLKYTPPKSTSQESAGAAGVAGQDDATGVAADVKKTGDAAKKAKPEVDKLAEALDDLFPEDVELRRLREVHELLDKGLASGKLTQDKYDEARMRLALGNRPDTFLESYFGENTDIADTIPDFNLTFDKSGRAMLDWAGKAAKVTETTAEKFKTMADSVIGSINDMSYAFSGGSFIDKLGAIVDLFDKISQLSIFKKGSVGGGGATARGVPAYASGTSWHPGGLALVGERGPELVSMPRGAAVMPNHRLGVGDVYNFQGNLMTPDFWAAIRSGDATAAIAGGNIGAANIARRQRRRVG